MDSTLLSLDTGYGICFNIGGLDDELIRTLRGVMHLSSLRDATIANDTELCAGLLEIARTCEVLPVRGYPAMAKDRILRLRSFRNIGGVWFSSGDIQVVRGLPTAVTIWPLKCACTYHLRGDRRKRILSRKGISRYLSADSYQNPSGGVPSWGYHMLTTLQPNAE